MHPRKLIRDAVVAALTGATAAGARVKATRVAPNSAAALPALAVYTPADDTDEDSIATKPRELLSRLTLKITGWIADTAALAGDDAMDALAEQIEAAMDVDRFLGGACGGEVGTVRMSTETGVLDDGDPIVGVVTLTYRAEYYSSPAPPALANDYLRTGTTTDMDGTGSAPTVSDLFDQRP